MSFNLDDPRITAYVFDELDDQQRAAFQAQLQQSAELREVVQQTKATLSQLSCELQSEPPMAMSAAQRENVAQEIQRVAASDAKPQPVGHALPISDGASSGRTWATLAVVAASLLLACGFLYVYHLRNSDRQIAAAPEQGDQEETAVSASTDMPTTASSVYGDYVPGKQSGESNESGSRVRRESSDDETGSLREENTAAPFGSAPYSDVSEMESGLVPATGLSTSSGSVDGLSMQIEQARRRHRIGVLGDDIAASQEQTMPRLTTPDPSTRPTAARPESLAKQAAPAPVPADAYGEMGGYDAMPVAPAPTPGQTASGGGYGGAMGGYGGAMGGMGGGGYGGEAGYGGEGYGSESTYGREYGTQDAYGRGVAGATIMESQVLVYGFGPDPPTLGAGPGASGDRYEPIVENSFRNVTDAPLSTFSIDVDTASYSKVRMHLMQNNSLPRPDAVRIEELVNYFTYDYQPPENDVPFAAHIEVADCPWTPEHRLVRFGIKGQVIDREERPTSNLVFLLDVSGSMASANKLPLVKQGMKMLVDQLGENDRVAIAVYAGAAGLVLESTTGDHRQVILDSLDRLHAGGSTNGGVGIQLAYQTALDNFVGGGVNRVILCTDGDFNVGCTGTDELVRLAEENAKTGVFLSVLGFGMGNHNDSMLEQVSNKGNGNYAYIDNESEARKVLVEQMMGTLITIAKDVKIQVEFNPAEVSAYRLIGYENRILAAEDFNDDQKDAGEIGAGHTVTALYEVVPAGSESGLATSPVDDLRYQSETKLSKAAKTGEMLTLKMRYKQPDGDTSALLTFPVKDNGHKFGQSSQDFRFAAAVASFGMLLRNSQHKGNATYAGVLETATEAASGDASGYRDEFLRMVERAKQLSGQ